MRFLFWFLLLAVAAVVAALAVKLNAGYALLVAPPYRIELSLNLLLILLVGGFLALYFVDPADRRARCGCPRRCASGAGGRSWSARAPSRTRAVVALLEGRYGKARQHARGSAGDSAARRA